MTTRSVNPVERYRQWYAAQPWRWRLWNTICWRAATVWAGLLGRVTPGEKLILKLYGSDAEVRKVSYGEV